MGTNIILFNLLPPGVAVNVAVFLNSTFAFISFVLPEQSNEFTISRVSASDRIQLRLETIAPPISGCAEFSYSGPPKNNIVFIIRGVPPFLVTSNEGTQQPPC